MTANCFLAFAILTFQTVYLAFMSPLESMHERGASCSGIGCSGLGLLLFNAALCRLWGEF